MHKKFDINRTKIKGGCQSGRKVVTHNSKSDLGTSINMNLLKFSKGESEKKNDPVQQKHGEQLLRKIKT